MTTTDQTTRPMFGPDPDWCTATNERHLTGADDDRHTDGSYRRAHDGPGEVLTFDAGTVSVGILGDEFALGGGFEIGVQLDASNLRLTPEQARQVAARLVEFANQVEAVQR